MSDILVRVSGACGRITLNRPRAMNALTPEMVRAMHAALADWANDARIHFVLIDGAGERGLCAGGDIRALYNAAVANERELTTEFFRGEYSLNYVIARYRKAYVALMDGIVMGGGIGISSHGSHRIVTERSQLAMPETAIGFVPDVGGTYLLGIAPDEIGTYLGLTGARVGAADAIFCGLADMMVSSGDLSRLTQDLEQCEDRSALEVCLRAYAAQPPPGMPDEQRAWIGECFSAPSVEAILEALARHPVSAARAVVEELKKMSPTSLKVTLAALRNGRAYGDLGSCLKQEFRIAQVCVRDRDFVEGVRAAIVDKDRSPKWSPSQLEEVTPEVVQEYFSGSSGEELDLT